MSLFILMKISGQEMDLSQISTKKKRRISDLIPNFTQTCLNNSGLDFLS